MKHKQQSPHNPMKAIVKHRTLYRAIMIFFFMWFVLLAIPATRSFAVQLLGILGFYGLCIGILRFTSLWTAIATLHIKSIIAIAVVSIAAVIFYAWYFTLYHYYPTWDRINYWSMTLRFNEDTSTSLVHTVKDVYWSINNADYNDLLCWVASLPTRFAPQWTSTFLALMIMFLIPAGFIISMFAYAHAAIPECQQAPTLTTIYVSVLCLPAFVRPVLVGYYDAAALLLFSIVLAAVFDTRILRSTSLRVLIGIGLAGTFLLRRWFIYACLGLAVAAIIYWSCKLVLTTSNNRRSLFAALIRSVLIIGITTVICVVPFPGFLRKSMFGNQSVAYQSWTIYTSYWSKLANVGQTIGWAWLAISIIGLGITVFMGVRRHESHLLQLASLQGSALIGALAGALMFWQIQDFSPQHWYIICVFIIISYALPLISWISNICQRTATYQAASITIITLSVVGLCHGIGAFAFPNPIDRSLSYVMGATITSPQQDNDLSEKQRLVDYLQQRTGGEQLVYFAAASDNLNSTLPLSTCLPECTESPFPVANADVDSYSGFNMQFFDAQYVVVSQPVQLHMNPDNEQLVTTLNNSVQDSDSIIGKHYVKAEEFTLDHGVVAFVYERTSPYSYDDIQQVSQLIGSLDSTSQWLFKQQFQEYLESITE